MSHVALSEVAEADLTEIWAFIAQDNIGAADRLIDEVHEKCQFLADQPEIGRLRPELDPSSEASRFGTI